MAKHRVFISYHHANDQWAKDRLIELNNEYGIFEDESVDTGDINDEYMTDEQIRIKIRDEYLRQTTVTILLVGTETQYRKHIVWEVYSSMRDSEKNPKSGIVVIMLPSTGCTHCYASHNEEKTEVFPTVSDWKSVNTRAEFERDYPCLPPRIIDNLLKEGVKISIATWNSLNVAQLRILIDNAFEYRENQDYDFTRPMRRRNG